MFSSNCMSPADMAAVMGTNNRGNDAFGGYGADMIIWLIVIAAIFNGGFGFGGWGGNGGFNSPAGQGALTRTDIDAALSTQGIESGITGIGSQLCNGFNSLSAQLADCCCSTKAAVADVNYNLAAQTNILQNTVNNNGNAIQQALNSGFRDVIDAQNVGTQRIVDLFTQDKIQSLQTELQSAQLQLSNAAQTNNIVNALRPTPVPAYLTCSPYQTIVNPTGFAFGVSGNGCGYNACGCGC